MNTYLHLYRIADAVFESDISWETKYDLIFSQELSVPMTELGNLDWYDLDSSYQDDVRAFMSAARYRAEEYKKVIDSYAAKLDGESYE